MGKAKRLRARVDLLHRTIDNLIDIMREYEQRMIALTGRVTELELERKRAARERDRLDARIMGLAGVTEQEAKRVDDLRDFVSRERKTVS